MLTAPSTKHGTRIEHVNRMALYWDCHLKTRKSFLCGHLMCSRESVNLTAAIPVAGRGLGLGSHCSRSDFSLHPPVFISHLEPAWALITASLSNSGAWGQLPPSNIASLSSCCSSLPCSPSSVLLFPVLQHFWRFSGKICSFSYALCTPLSFSFFCPAEGSFYLLRPSPIICLWLYTIPVSSEMERETAFLLVFWG